MNNHVLSLTKLGAAVFKVKRALKTAISIPLQGLFVLLFLFLTTLAPAQNFQRIYGTTGTNTYKKVVQDGSNYYVLGTENLTGARSDEHGTVSRVDANGTLLWTTRILNMVLNDAIVTPTGNLLFVGESVGGGGNNQSIFGLITPTGSLTWTRFFEYPGQETISKIVRNPVPLNATFPYYAVGKHTVGAGFNTVLFNLNEAGAFNWKKHYATTEVGNFSNDLEALPNGDMLICGKRGTLGVIYKMNNAGTLTSGLLNNTFTNMDMATVANGSIYLASTNGAGVPHLSKFNASFLPTWERTLAGLTAISQVAVDPVSSDIIVTGRRTIGTLPRVVICRFSDVNNVVTLLSVKYLDNGETSFVGGSTTVLSNGKLAYADGRIPVINGFGGNDGFMSVSELDITTSCMTKQSPFQIATLTAGYQSPVLPLVNFYDLITPTTFTSQASAWQQAGACACVPPNLTATSPASVCAPTTINLANIVVGDANNITNPVTYHTTAASAVTGAGALTGAALTISTVGTTTIWIRKAGSTTACYDTVSVVITINPALRLTNGALTICAGASANLNNLIGGGPIVNPIWHQGSLTGPVVNPIVSPTVTTTYFIEGQNSSGCRATAQVVITVTPKPNAGNDVALVCEGGIAQSIYNFNQSGTWTVLSQPTLAAATISTAGLAANMSLPGSYFFVLTVNGCRDTVRVTTPTCGCITPNLVASNPPSVCAPSTINLTSIVVTDVSSVNNPLTYHATAANAVTGASPLIGANLTISVIGTTTIWIRKAGSAAPCYDTVSVQITINLKPVYFGRDVRVCAGTTLDLTQYIPNYGSVVNPMWFFQNGTVVPNPTAVTPSVQTTYTFIGGNASGCRDTAQIFVLISPKPNAGADVVLTCTGGVAPTTYNFGQIGTWAIGTQPSGASASISSAGAASNMTVAGIYTFYLIVNECRDTVNITVPKCIDQPQSIFKCGQAVVTCFSGFISGAGAIANPTGPVLAIVDIRNHITAPLGMNWPTVGLFHDPTWDAQHMGQIFGVTIDNNYNVYAASSTIYGKYLPTGMPNTAFGNVYKINSSGGAPIVFATLPQNTANPAGLGDVWFDASNSQFFVSNFFDGKIYCLDMSGAIKATHTYDFPGTALGVSSPGFIARGERVWAVATYQNRLYFSVWNEDRIRIEIGQQNRIYSIGLDATTGAPTGAAILEITLPPFLTNAWSSPVSDITFSSSGKMLVSERSMYNDFGNAYTGVGAQAHASRILEFSGAGWSAPVKTLYVGNVAGPNFPNSAGGIDYGYESFNPTTNPSPTLCDSTVWGTGDALRYPGQNTIIDGSTLPCGGGTNDFVYGLTGVRASGNSNVPGPLYVKDKSIYIDLDHNICSGEKTQIGDVDVFKNCVNCPNTTPNYPCDSLMVMVDSVRSSDSCCYVIDLKNQLASPSLTKICANLTTPNWVFNTGSLNLAGGWSFDLISPTQICFKRTTGTIPLGNLNDVLTFCLAKTTTTAPSVQQIIFDWYAGDAVICKDTIRTNCPGRPEDPCLVVSNMRANCFGENDLEYCLNFTVTNLNAFTAYSLILAPLPPGYAYGNCGCGGAAFGAGSWQFSNTSGLIAANGSANFCVKIISTTPVLSPRTVCMKATLDFGNKCCTSPKDWCFELRPCCNPCQNASVAVRPIEGNCCYAVDFKNNCDFGYFTRIDFDIQTLGVSYGWHSTSSSFCAPPTTMHACVLPALGSTFLSGTHNNLFNFCLTDINLPAEIPQVVSVKFWTIGSNGQDSLACDTLLRFNCPLKKDTCLFVTNERIRCVPDSMKYVITLDVTNLAVPHFTAAGLMISSDPTIMPNPIPFSPPLTYGNTTTVTFMYTPAIFPDPDGILPLIYGLKNVAGDSCCLGGAVFRDTLKLPSCDSCICGTFTNLFFRPAQGAQTVSVKCGDTLSVGCNPQFNPILNGSFNCLGNNCPPTPPIIHWELRPLFTGGPALVQGNISGGAFNLSLLASYFTTGGLYELTLSASCNGKACPPCKFIIRASGCGACECGSFTDIFYRPLQGAQSQSKRCGDTLNVFCNPQFTPVLTGNFACIGECPAKGLNWVIRKTPTGPPIQSGTLTVPNFTLPLPASYFTGAGFYELTLTGTCGTTTCPPCKFIIKVDSCCAAPPCNPCCKDSLVFNNLVNQGFTIVNNGCSVTVTAPQFDTCFYFSSPPVLDDQLSIQVITNPNGSWTYTFTPAQSGTHKVCVTVFDGCGKSRVMCTTFQVNCGISICQCGNFTDMFYRPAQGAQSQSKRCSDTLTVPCNPQFSPVLSGVFNCIGQCSPAGISWEMRKIVNGVAGSVIQSGALTYPNFSLPLLASYFTGGGFYELTLIGQCGTAASCLPCKFILNVEPCNEQCRCGSFSNMTYRPTQGAQTISKICGDTLIFPCNSTFNPLIGGTFACIGTCPITPAPIQWSIVGGASGTLTGPNFSLALLASYFPTPGVYQITFTSQCGSQTCPPCRFFIKVENCNTCECKGFEKLSFYNSNWSVPSKPTKCDSSMQLPCVLPNLGGIFLFHGDFLCSSKICLTDSASWSIGQGNTKIESGSSVLTPDQFGQPKGHFDIFLNPAWFTPGVQYTITVTGMCGTKVCTCKVNFTVAACPCACPLTADVAKGFKTIIPISPTPCQRLLMPIGLCPTDVVMWSINGVNVAGTTLGNAAKTITFPGSGSHDVCMTVVRTVNGQTCTGKFCRKVKVYCGPPDQDPTLAFCKANGVKNGNFTEGAKAGHLNGTGAITNWQLFPNIGDGSVMIDDNSGSYDAGHLIFNGDKGNFAAVSQRVSLQPNTFTTLEFEFKNYNSESTPTGTVLEFRLEPDLVPGGPSQVLYTQVIRPEHVGWTSTAVSVRVSPNPEYPNLIVCVRNENEGVKSSVGIDNLVICTGTVSDVKSLDLVKPIHIYPNPNTGLFTVELPQPATRDMKFRITNLTGAVMFEKQTKTGSPLQTMDAGILPDGLYFLHVVSEGKMMAVEKFVKQ